MAPREPNPARHKDVRALRRKRGKETPRARILEPHERAQFFATLDAWPHPEFVALVRLALYTACRKSELLTLRWGDVRQDDRGQTTLYLRGTKGHAANEVVPLALGTAADVSRGDRQHGLLHGE